jgi:hypothetical protein
MGIEVFIVLIIIFFLRSVYAFKEKKALSYWGNRISGNIGEKVKNESPEYVFRLDPSFITPWSSTIFFYLNIAIFLAAMVTGFLSIQWYILIFLCLFFLFAVPGFSMLLPKAESKFWYNRIYNGLDYKKRHYEKIENFLKIEACYFLLQNFDELKNFFGN